MATQQQQINLLTKAIAFIGGLLIAVLSFSGAMFHSRLSAIETILMQDHRVEKQESVSPYIVASNKKARTN